jgi:hypothetical protein
MSKKSKRGRTSAASRRSPEGANLDLYEATIMYLAASRAIEAHTKQPLQGYAGHQRARRTRT